MKREIHFVKHNNIYFKLTGTVTKKIVSLVFCFLNCRNLYGLSQLKKQPSSSSNHFLRLNCSSDHDKWWISS